MFKLPFHILPGSWGLKGKTRERARIEYYIEDPYSLEHALLELDHKFGDITEEAFKIGEIELERKFKYSSDIDCDTEILKIKRGSSELSEVDFEIGMLDIAKRRGDVTTQQYERQLADIKDEPYIEVIETDFDPTKPEKGSFTFDWNDRFIDELKKAGYGIASSSETDLIEEWFSRICLNTAMEGGFVETPTPLTMSPVQKQQRPDGKAEYS